MIHGSLESPPWIQIASLECLTYGGKPSNDLLKSIDPIGQDKLLRPYGKYP